MSVYDSFGWSIYGRYKHVSQLPMTLQETKKRLQRLTVENLTLRALDKKLSSLQELDGTMSDKTKALKRQEISARLKSNQAEEDDLRKQMRLV